jgi:hypothetical protein
MLREFTRLPAADAVSDFPELLRLMEEHEKTLKEFRSGEVRHEQLEKVELAEARRADKRERVEAHRQGKADPGHSHEEKVLAKIKEVEDFCEVREGAYTAIERDIAQLVTAKPRRVV